MTNKKKPTRAPRDISHITLEYTLHLLMDDATARNLMVGKGLTLASFYLISFGRLHFGNQGKQGKQNDH